MDIKDPVQLEKAKLEDTLIDLLYREYPDIVFHGGTAIWRCYSGNRFSRDLDFYIKATSQAQKDQMYSCMQQFFRGLGFSVKESGYSRATGTMHILLEANVKMKVDINFRYKKGVPTEYVRVDESRIVVLSLTPLQLLGEKIDAYENKLEGSSRYSVPEAQDLYDMYHLVSLVKAGKTNASRKRLNLLLDKIERNPPSNMRSLGHIILNGLPPSFEIMVKRLREWANDDN